MRSLAITVLLLLTSILSFSQYNQKYELINLGRKVNTGYHEAAPVISPDGKVLYFFVTNHPENNEGTEGSQDIWYSELQPDSSWGEAKHIKKPLNDHASNQVFNILPDGRILIRGGKSKRSRGFSFTRKLGNEEFAKPEVLDIEDLDDMNVGKFYGATVSSDARHLILYMSERENYSFSDLYISHLMEDGTYSRPKKLARNINTSRDEFGPFMAPDDKTMYFSSNRKDMGLGNADIYMTKRLDDTWEKWSDPVNMGRPLNTSAFDAYMSVDANGHIFVTMAGDPRDGGNLDIFQLVKKDIKITLKGMVYNDDTREKIEATIQMLEHDTVKSDVNKGYKLRAPGEGTYKFKASREGFLPQSYSITIPEVYNDTTIERDLYLIPENYKAELITEVFDAKSNELLEAMVTMQLHDRVINETTNTLRSTIEHPGWYFMTASAEGYLNQSDSVYYDGKSNQELLKQLYLTPIEVGTTVRLNDIYFDFDKTTLKEVSFIELNKVVDFLNKNPTLEIEIAGHTDSKGSDNYNLDLSQGRAQAVVDYLISQGIDTYRLQAHGYGETRPVATNDTDEGRAENRRVEFTVLKK